MNIEPLEILQIEKSNWAFFLRMHHIYIYIYIYIYYRTCVKYVNVHIDGFIVYIDGQNVGNMRSGNQLARCCRYCYTTGFYNGKAAFD